MVYFFWSCVCVCGWNIYATDALIVVQQQVNKASRRHGICRNVDIIVPRHPPHGRWERGQNSTYKSTNNDNIVLLTSDTAMGYRS